MLLGINKNAFGEEMLVQEDFFGSEMVAEEKSSEETEKFSEEENLEIVDFDEFTDGKREGDTNVNDNGEEIDTEKQLLSGNDVVETGECGNNLTYTITGDEKKGYALYISGNGDMYDYRFSNVPWEEKKKNIVKIVIEGKGTSIADSAFWGCSRLVSVTISEGVTDISYAFGNCSSLTSVTIPNGVTNINGAFAGCSSLVSVTIPDSVTEMNEAFSDCVSLISANIPRGVTEKFVSAFDTCINLNSIVIPENVTYIPERAFANCSSLTSIVIPQGVRRVGFGAFMDCSNLINVEISNSVTELGEAVFENCDSLRSIIIPENVISIGSEAFRHCSNLSAVIIPESVTRIGSSAFENCRKLNNVVIPENVTEIESSTFLDCYSLTSIIIPSNVTDIDYRAFFCCINLRSIIIPESVICIEQYVFDGCENLLSIRYTGTKEQWDKLNVSLIGAKSASVYYKVLSSHEHSYEERILKKATCIENGSEVVICKICGEYYEKDIPALGHVVVKDMAVAATCTVQGKTEGSHCSICGKVFVPQRNISITAHSWDTWNVIKAATTSKEGEQRRVCNKCGKIESKKIAKLSSVHQTLIINRGKTATLKPSSTWKNIKYSSSNKKVATVDKKGKIKAIAAGTVKITVKSGSKKAVCTVTIPGTTAIKGVKSLIAVKKGKSCILKPKLNYVGTADAITYKTSNKKIATVSKTGTIKGRKKGTVIITIKSGKVTKTCKVKVK